MRETTLDTPTLFDTPAADIQSAASEGKKSAFPAHDFTRWLFSFGPDFRNSPDMTNLRFWLDRQSLALNESEERELLAEARVLFAKKLEQFLRKPETTPQPEV